MQHPEEGTLHAYLDGELPAAEASSLELHVGECARCAAALAEARGLVAAASRVITTLDAAPASPAVVTPAPAGASPAPERRAAHAPFFRVPYARAAALLLLVGGSAVVLDRSGTFAGGEDSASEALLAEAATGSDLAATSAPEETRPTAAVSGAATPTGAGANAAPTRPAGALLGAADNAAQKAAAPPVVAATTAAEAASRRAERSPAVSARTVAPVQGGGVSVGAMARDAAADSRPPAVPSPSPPRAAMAADGIVVTGASGAAVTVSRYRTRTGAILTLTEEPLRTSFAEESVATRQSSALSARERTTAAAAAPVMNTYRWSSADAGKIYTLTGPLTVPELEAVSKRLGELERVP